MKRRVLLLISLLMMLVLLLASCSTPTGVSQAQPAEATNTSSQVQSPDGKTLMEEKCSTCHALSRVTSKSATSEEWKGIVERMVSKGATLTQAEQDILTKYLAETYK